MQCVHLSVADANLTHGPGSHSIITLGSLSHQQHGQQRLNGLVSCCISTPIKMHPIIESIFDSVKISCSYSLGSWPCSPHLILIALGLYIPDLTCHILYLNRDIHTSVTKRSACIICKRLMINYSDQNFVTLRYNKSYHLWVIVLWWHC